MDRDERPGGRLPGRLGGGAELRRAPQWHGMDRPMRHESFRQGGTAILLVVAAQGLCALVFVISILAPLAGAAIRPVPWALRETLEIGAGLGLSIGFLFGTAVLWRSLRDRRRAEQALRRARADFREQLAERFGRWGLTPAEADVAIFAIKGLRLQEIAELRRTSEGTVKAQTNAIYRKAGVNGRSQLLSLFIEDLMEDAGEAAAKETDLPLRRAA